MTTVKDSILKYCLPALLVLWGGLPQVASGQTMFGIAGGRDARENAINCDWAYNWANRPRAETPLVNYEYVPMIWSGGPNGVINQVNTIKNQEAAVGVPLNYVLGFNEPELSTQANMTVATAIATWEVIQAGFEGTGAKLVSPAVSGQRGLDDWLQPFMEIVETRNSDSNTDNDLQVDVIAYHFYSVGFNGAVEANKLLDQIDKLYVDYQRPIWLTEFAGTSFSLDNPVHSVEERTAFNKAFLETLIPAFEARDYVERVAWWQFGALGRPYSALSTVNNGVYTPTALGEVYSRTTLEEGSSYNLAAGETSLTDVHYLKGGALTNSGAAQPIGLRAIDALSGDSVFGGTGNFGFEVAEDDFLRVRSGATLRKQGSNQVSLDGALIDVAGSLLVEGGTLQFEDIEGVSGGGTIRVNANAKLELSQSANQDQAIRFSEDMVTILNHGELHVVEGRAVINGQLRFWNQSVVRTDGDLIVNGNTTGANRLVSSGTGNLFLTGVSTRPLGTTVDEGGLFVVNEDASATGDQEVLVTGTGTFGGFGLVGGDVRVETAGTVSPGTSTGADGVRPAGDFVEGAVVDAIVFDFTGVQDNGPITQTSTLNSAITLESGLDFGSGLFPNAVSAGDEFNLSGFATTPTWSGAFDANDYLTFTIAPIPGLAMKLQDVSFELRRNGGAAATKYRLLTSIDGFEPFDEPLTPFTYELAGTDDTTGVFTASYLGSEAVTEPVEVRLYGWAAANNTANTRFTGASLNASFVSDPDSVVLDPTGILSIGGDYTQLAFAKLAVDVGGTDSGQFDQLVVDGNVALAGTLDLSSVDGYVMGAGDTFDIITANSITGEFDTVLMPEDWTAEVVYSDSAVRLQVQISLPGDANGNGEVNNLDIMPFALALFNRPAYVLMYPTIEPNEVLDMNGDGRFNNLDIAGFAAALGF